MQTMRKAFVWWSYVSLTFCAAEAQSTEPALFGVYTNDSQSSDGINSAIKKTAADVNFLIRPFVRNALVEFNPAYKRVSIERTETEIAVQFDARKPTHLPADGSVAKWTREDGTIFDVTAAWQDGQLIQTFVADNGTRINAFRLSPDGQTLTLDVTMGSSQIPSAVKYQLVFRRQ